MLWLVAVLILVVLVVGALVSAGLSAKPVQRTPSEVAEILRNFVEGAGGKWDWDDFESVPIADPELDRIRREAALAAPPDPDMEKLRDLLRQAEDLARR